MDILLSVYMSFKVDQNAPVYGDFIITSYVIRHNANIAHKWQRIIVENM